VREYGDEFTRRRDDPFTLVCFPILLLVSSGVLNVN
jgi:hypothetical protein